MGDRKLARGRAHRVNQHQTRHTGVIVVVLLVGSVAVALYLAHFYHLGVPQTIVTVLIGGGAPAGLYLAWATYRDSRHDAAEGENSSLATIADQLARLVGQQWEKEEKVRQLGEPFPLPVSWVAADESMADAWDVLVTLATSGHGWPAPPPAGTWAASPDGLAGTGRDLLKVLERVPTGRLIVLGEPGAGKTMLMVGLVLDVLAGRASGGPVPVLVPLASWKPKKQDLLAWLASQLIIDYPALDAAAPPSEGDGTRVDALLAADLIFPILDGLDEMPAPVRAQALDKINDALRPGRRLVVACRTEQYREAIDTGANLHAAAVIQLCPLHAAAISAYLSAAGGPGTTKRWAPVLAALGTQSPVGETLTRPLMVGLARAIYSPRPGELAGNLRDPKELCDLADRAAVESHLFNAFIPAAYHAGPICRWTAQQAEVWLVFLARHLQYQIKSPDYAWWELKRALPYFKNLNPGPSSRMRLGIADFLFRLFLSFMFIAGGAVTVLFGADLISGMGHFHPIGNHLFTDWVALTYFSFAMCILFWLLIGLQSVPADLDQAASPRAVLARDRHATLILWLGSMIGFGLFFAGALTFFRLLHGSLWIPVASGVVIGFALGLTVSIGKMASPLYWFDRGRLALSRRLPWSLMSFLDDAHQRGVLRQVGAVYQFRHIELQNRLAAR